VRFARCCFCWPLLFPVPLLLFAPLLFALPLELPRRPPGLRSGVHAATGAVALRPATLAGFASDQACAARKPAQDDRGESDQPSRMPLNLRMKHDLRDSCPTPGLVLWTETDTAERNRRHSMVDPKHQARYFGPRAK
jgi:hypothetical protein